MAALTRPVFILGFMNDADGRLSSTALSRIEAGLTLQSADPNVVLLATGGFGAHFNVSTTPHREWVYRALAARGARFDRAGASDLLSANTVEDIAMIATFSARRGFEHIEIVTSHFHVPRCHFIAACLAPSMALTIIAADDPPDFESERRDHETRALAQLNAQGGVVVDGVLHPHP